MAKRPKIVFYGTPEFAVHSLEAILLAGFPVAAVVTAPDKPSGRGLKLRQSDVKRFAAENNIPVLQPDKLKSEDFLSQLTSIHPDIQVVVAFRKLPATVWKIAPTFNLHASLLPQYRGAAPINRAIMNGEKESGVTTFFINEKIDTGDMILQEAVTISPTETAGSLHDKLAHCGAGLVVKTIDMISKGSIQLQPQPETGLIKSAPKLTKEVCRIDWNKDITSIYNHIRGLSPYPAAWTLLDNRVFKIFNCTMHECVHTEIPGTSRTDRNFKVFAKGGCLKLEKVQMESKKRMTAEEFLRGWDKDKQIIFQ